MVREIMTDTAEIYFDRRIGR